MTKIKNLIAAGMILAYSMPIHAESEFSVNTPDGRRVTLTAITDNIVKVSNVTGTPRLPHSQASVIDTPEGNATVTQLTPEITAFATPGGIVATVNAISGEVTISAGANKTVTDNGVRVGTDGMRTLTLSTTSTGSFYGAGERGHSLNLRGDTLVMYNRQNYGYTKGDPRIDQMNITMPVVLSSDGFALVFDDYAAASLVLTEGSQIVYESETSFPISYFYVNGASTLADVTEQLTALTGRQPLPPLWSLGYITSKYGYHNEKETLGAIDSLKRRGYPVDGIVLDLYWYGKEQDMGRLEWESSQWPDPQKMLSKLKKENVNLVAISQPYILRNGKAIDNYNFLAMNGMLMADSTGENPQEVKIWVGEGGMFDMSNQDTRDWLAERYGSLTDMGVAGWWGDLGEPEVHPETGFHANGLTARQYHNQYGNDWSKIIHDLFKEKYPDRRLLTMMRGGTTGLQRYSVFPWSTDVSRSWGGLQPQVTIMLNSGLSGLGYMGHDVGGFAVDPENPVDPELYVRWLQLGLFSPMLRTHAQHNAEPYHYPEYQDITLKLIRERYRWLPYNYTLAYENAIYGWPLVRPLNFYEPSTTVYDDIDDEYLWGSELLVAPVMQQGAVSRKVVFPRGRWVDYADPGKVYAGGSEISYPAPLDVMPLFVKAGAFLPMADYKMKSTADYNPAVLTVEYYPVQGVESSFTLYDDNRISPQSLSSGEYRLITFKGDCTPGGTSIEISSVGGYPEAPTIFDLTFCVKNPAMANAKVTVDGKEVKTANGADGLTFRFKYQPDKVTNIEIR
ncbi:MAG: DUF5110 domain-containing protein [Muribaculaceae bacterium]|nr:DUF5110 domain-containing protein [Muribaculaceae bacterium]